MQHTYDIEFVIRNEVKTAPTTSETRSMEILRTVGSTRPSMC